MESRASWTLGGRPRLVCLVEGGDLLQGGLVSLRKKKSYTDPKKKNPQQYKPTKNARNASSANQINK